MPHTILTVDPADDVGLEAIHVPGSWQLYPFRMQRISITGAVTSRRLPSTHDPAPRIRRTGTSSVHCALLSGPELGV